jgi:hypothetical protein
LIKINGYTNFNDFIDKKVFKGNICFYEYYYVKGLLYNNFELIFGSNINDFKNIYEQISSMMANENIQYDNLLEDVYNNSFYQKNYKYIIIK